MPVHLENMTYLTEHTEVWRSKPIEIRRTITNSYGIDTRTSTSTIWEIDINSKPIRLYCGELITLRNMLAKILGDDDNE